MIFSEKDIGSRLKEIRKELRFQNQEEFASILGITQTQISKYESGTNSLPDTVRAKIYELGYSLDWLLSGEGEMLRSQKPQADNVFKIPLLTKEQTMHFDIIRDTKAHTGNYPETLIVPVSESIREYSTDLRAIRVFNNRMAPLLSAGNIAIFEASGWNDDGIYVYFMSDDLHISHVVWDGRAFILTKEFKPEEPIPYDETSFYCIGRVRAVLKEI